MSVDVDWGTGRVIYDVEASTAFTNPTASIVEQRGQGVYNYLLSMETAADNAAEAALTQINNLRDFNVAIVPIQYEVPDGPSYELTPMPNYSVQSINAPNPSAGSIAANFNYSTEDAVDDSWAEPDSVSYTAPEPPGLGTTYPLPQTPGDYDFPDVAPPDYTAPTFTPDNLIPPNLLDIDVDALDIVEIEDFSISDDTQALLDLIQDMESYDPTPPTLPEYTYLIPEIFTVTASMAQGNPVVEYQRLLDARDALLAQTEPSTAMAFVRRGLASPDGAPAYDEWLDFALKDKLDDSDAVFSAIADFDCVTSAFQLATAAHRMLTDIEIALYDLEFALAKASVNARLEKAKLVSAVYQARVLLLQNEIAQYNALAAQVQANAQVFAANAEQVEFVGQVNRVTADVFAAEESVKDVDADVFKARVTAEAAKLQQYKARIESYKSYVAEAETQVAAFAGATALYSAEVDRLSNDYDVFASQQQAVQFQNSARAAAVQASGSELRAIAAETEASAAEAVARSAELRADAANREGSYIQKALQNDLGAAELRVDGSDYNQSLTNYVLPIVRRRAELGVRSAYADSIRRHVVSANDAISRAASLSQRANITLTRAYEQIYTTAGQAGAAVAAGRLSGFRAQATLTASDSLQSADSYSVGYSGRGTNAYSETDLISE